MAEALTADQSWAPDPFDPVTARWSDDTPAPPDALEQWQLARAWDIAERAARDTAFYRNRLSLPSTRTAADFRTLATTTKDEVVADCEQYPPYGSRLTVDAQDIRHIVETSGTSGKGREIYALNDTDEEAIFRTEAVGFWWAGVRPGSRVLLTLPVGTTAAGLWYYGGLRLLGANVFSVGSYPTDRKVEILRRYGADMIVSTPSYLQRLAAACEDAGLDPARFGVSSLMVSGEAYGLRWAEDIQQRWSATLYEQYGCTERAIGWTCPGGVVKDGQLGVLHFPPEAAYLEVVDPEAGQPVANGEYGEMITTPFQASASPLVRFATRDRVRWFAPGACACGRPLAGIAAGGVQRYDRMMKIRGVNVWPEAFDGAILSVEGIRDYRGYVRQDAGGRELIDVYLECAPTAAGDVSQRVADAVRDAVGLTVQPSLVEAGAITGSIPEGFVKVSRWQDERQQGRS